MNSPKWYYSYKRALWITVPEQILKSKLLDSVILSVAVYAQNFGTLFNFGDTVHFLNIESQFDHKVSNTAQTPNGPFHASYKAVSL